MKSIFEFIPPGYDLRPVQIKILSELEANWHKYDVFLAPAMVGCHGPGERVLMYDGSTKAAEDVIVGDTLMGPDSTPRKVLNLCRGTDKMYRVTPIKGEPMVVNGNHILSLKKTPSRKGQEHKLVNMSLNDVMAMPDKVRQEYKFWRTGVDFNQSVALPVDPYILGIWLGDGSTKSATITSMDQEVISAWTAWCEGLGLVVRELTKDNGNNLAKTYSAVTQAFDDGVKKERNPITTLLRSVGIYENKNIPKSYLTASREDRLQLLAGLLDTDGSLCHGGYDFVQKRKDLSDGVAFLARSVGLAAYVKECRKGCQTGAVGTYYRVSISGDCDIIPCRVVHKKSPPRQQKKSVLVSGFSIEALGDGAYYGWHVDADHLYLMHDFTVTHNSGKSVVFIILSAWLKAQGKTSAIVTPQVMLQDQYTEDFEDVPSLKGKSRYECESAGNCEKHYDFSNEYCDGCPYVAARKAVKREKCGIFNFSSYLYSYKFAWGKKHKDDEHFIKTYALLVDECFPAGQRVRVAGDTTITIKTIYDKWKAGEQVVVQSYNEATKQFEYKPVTHAWKRPPKNNMVKVTAYGFSSTCTANHPFLTHNRGWVKAGDLLAGDRLMSLPSRNSRLVPTYQQNQVLLGSYLGDGYVRADSALTGQRITIRHAVDQEQYLEWKCMLLGTELTQGGTSGYGGQPQVHTNSAFFDISINSVSEALEKLDTLGLAIWIMDDGSVVKYKDEFYGYRIHTESYSREDQELIRGWFKSKHDVAVTIQPSKGKYYYISIGKEDAQKLRDKIAPFVPEVMRYKVLGTAVSYNYTPTENTQLGSREVTGVESVSKVCDLYDIEVADNHNFVISNTRLSDSGVVVHNCHNLFDSLADHYSWRLYKKDVRNYSKVSTIGDALVVMEKQIKELEVHLSGIDQTQVEGREEARDTRRAIRRLAFAIDGIQRSPKEYFFEKKQSRTGEYIQVKPINFSSLQPHILRQPAKIVLMSGTINHLDVNKLGLGGKAVYHVECPSAIDPAQRPVIFRPAANMGYKHQDISVPIMAKALLALIDENPGDKGLIHMPYALADKFRAHMNHPRLLWHTKDDKADKYQEFRTSPEPLVLVASGMAEGIDLPYEAGRWQAIVKIQYPSLADPLMQYYSQKEKDYYSWLTTRTVTQQAGRICRTPTDYGVTFILDVAFENLLRYNRRLFPRYFLDALIIESKDGKADNNSQGIRPSNRVGGGRSSGGVHRQPPSDVRS